MFNFKIFDCRSKERKIFDNKVKFNDNFILDLLEILKEEKPIITLENGNYRFKLKNLDILVSRYSYIYISGYDLEYSSTDIRFLFSRSVKTIFQNQNLKN